MSSNLDQPCGFTACSALAEPDVASQSVSQDEFESAANNILKNLGVTSCKYTQTIDETAAQIQEQTGLVLSPFGVGGAYTASGTTGETDSTTSAIGCEQIAVTAVRYVQTKKSIMEILNCSCTNIDQSAVATNKVRLVAHGSVIDCDLVINQEIQIKTIALNEVSTEMKQEIERLTTDFLDFSIDKMVTDSGEMGKTPSGQKSVTDLKTELNSEETQRQINENITNMIQTINADNEIVVEIHDSVLSGSSCKMDQNILLEVVATNILSSSMDLLFKSQEFKDIMTKTDETQESEQEGMAGVQEARNEGITAIGEAIGLPNLSNAGFIVLLVIFLLLPLLIFMFSPWYIQILILIIIILIVVLRFV